MGNCRQLGYSLFFSPIHGENCRNQGKAFSSCRLRVKFFRAKVGAWCREFVAEETCLRNFADFYIVDIHVKCNLILPLRGILIA